MIYSPAHYKEDRSELIFEVIRRYSFATLITSGDDRLNEPFVSHLPLILEEGNKTLIGHCARANPQWRHFGDGRALTTIFHGPHAYISPAWYQPRPDNVPTWNYVAVHVSGCATLIENPTDAFATLQALVRRFEGEYGTKWQLPDRPNADLDQLLKAIVAFRIEIKSVQGKFKLSQKQAAVDRATVVSHLPAVAGAEGAAVADYMNKVSRAMSDER